MQWWWLLGVVYCRVLRLLLCQIFSFIHILCCQLLLLMVAVHTTTTTTTFNICGVAFIYAIPCCSTCCCGRTLLLATAAATDGDDANGKQTSDATGYCYDDGGGGCA